MNFFNELARITEAQRELMGLPKFNDPSHLPQPLRWPEEEPARFDIYDDQQMKDICGAGLDKPIQNLLITHAHGANTPPEKFKEIVMRELAALREAVKEEWRGL